MQLVPLYFQLRKLKLMYLSKVHLVNDWTGPWIQSAVLQSYGSHPTAGFIAAIAHGR